MEVSEAGGWIEVAAAGSQPQPRRFDQRSAAADERVENHRAPVRIGAEQTLNELRGELPIPRQQVGPHPLGNVEAALGERFPSPST